MLDKLKCLQIVAMVESSLNFPTLRHVEQKIWRFRLLLAEKVNILHDLLEFLIELERIRRCIFFLLGLLARSFLRLILLGFFLD